MAQTPVIVNSTAGAATIEYRAAADKTAGDVVVVGTVPMIVKRDIDYSEDPLGTVTDGRGDVDWLMPQKAEAITAGDRVYWDATGNPYGGTSGSGAVTGSVTAVPIGIAAPSQPNGTNATAATDSYIRVIPNCTDVAPSTSGTTGTSFVVDSDSSTPKLAIGSQTAGTGNYITTMKSEATLSANTTVIVPETADNDVLVSLALAQTLTNKTLTNPTITGGYLSTTPRFGHTVTPVAAVGSAVGDAGALADTLITHVTSDGAGKGVVLPAVTTAGVIRIVINNTAGTACELYAESTGTVNGLAGDASIVLPAATGVICISTAAKTWLAWNWLTKSSAS
jgi:predicted RecA/RadA family phage recombinase